MRFVLGLAILLASAPRTAWCAADPVDAILTKMDHAAAAFKGMTADLRQVAHTAVINDDQIASGTIRVKRVAPGNTLMLVNFTEPDPKTVQLQGHTLEIYLPRTNTVDEYNLGKNSSLIEQFLLLGFGTTRADLTSNNEVKYLGAEPLNGHPAVELQLTPKSPDVLAHVQKIEMWVSPETGYPLQHQIFQQGGDYQRFEFSSVRMELNLSDSSLRLKLPKNVKRETPQH